jgi:hypothetical protein
MGQLLLNIIIYKKNLKILVEKSFWQRKFWGKKFLVKKVPGKKSFEEKNFGKKISGKKVFGKKVLGKKVLGKEGCTQNIWRKFNKFVRRLNKNEIYNIKKF